MQANRSFHGNLLSVCIQSYFSYPKTKSALYQKYLNGKTIESGKSVWDLYEAKNYAAIRARSNDEITDSLAIYKAMFDIKKATDASLERLKKLDKANQQVTSPAEPS